MDDKLCLSSIKEGLGLEVVASEYRIKGTRKMRKMSGTEVAAKLGISPQYYYDIERGKKGLSADKALSLSKIFDVPIEFLLGLPYKGDYDLLSADMYADGYTDESFLEELEEQMEKSLRTKEERDIAVDLERMMAELDSDEAIAFHGEALDPESKELLRISLENSMRLAKQLAKKKFTPNSNSKE